MTGPQWAQKKPVKVRYIQFDGTNRGEIVRWIGANGRDVPNPLGQDFIIPTLEGGMTASVGDFVIQGVANEFYPCKPDIFDATYDRDPSDSGSTDA